VETPAMPKQRSILIISALDLWSMGKGRGGPALTNTLKGYVDRGWKVFFITGSRNQSNIDKEFENSINIVRFDASWIHKLRGAGFSRVIGFLAMIIWWIYFQFVAFVKGNKIIRKHDIDVVYGYEVFGVPVTKMLSVYFSIPAVSRFQGTVLTSRLKDKFWYLRSWHHVVGLSIPMDLIIMGNDGTQGDRVLRKFGIDMDKERFWMNGVGLDAAKVISAEKSEIRKRLDIHAKYVFLTVSRLVVWKHVERSIYAMSEIVREFPDTVLIIVGEGPEKERLKQFSFKLNIDKHVRFEGAVPHNKVPEYLGAADIFLSFYDLSNVGNPLLEAMIAGKCIITLNIGDTDQFIRNEENGILLDHADRQSISQAAKSLLANEKCRQRLGDNARKFALEKFWTWEARMDAEIQAVEKLLTS
jgi:glycosyltransferase involved in cell wall biosynthesis